MPLRGRAGTLLLVASVTFLVAPTGKAAVAVDPVIVGAGDIAVCGSAGDEATAKVLDSIPGTVVALGDNAYPDGTTANFRDCYGPSWGRHKDRTRPAIGNHEYKTAGAGPYFDYFGSAAGNRGEGWYSYDLGAWHIVVLNSNCTIVGCGATSKQATWLKSDLEANADKHILAYWHHPRYSSSLHGDSLEVQTFWELLYAAGAEIVLNGHDHDYERFGPQDPWARADAAFGIRQFVVGTGGAALRPMGTKEPNSQIYSMTHGVLMLTLRADGYEWVFVPVAGKTFTDSGTGRTHEAPPPRTRMSFAVTGDSWVDQAHPKRNYGSATTLLMDGNTTNGLDAHTYMKAAVSKATGTINRAALRMWVTNNTADGPTVAPTTCSWSASTITWANRPPAKGPVVADMRRSAKIGAWTEIDVTRIVRSNGTFCFLLRPTSSDALTVSSNQGSHPPRLIVETIPAP
jgi:hypothetical protein